jgi:hypothetical protein
MTFLGNRPVAAMRPSPTTTTPPNPYRIASNTRARLQRSARHSRRAPATRRNRVSKRSVSDRSPCATIVTCPSLLGRVIGTNTQVCDPESNSRSVNDRPTGCAT